MKIWDSLKAKINPEYPAPHKLADADDDLGWAREVHGRMQDFATADDEIKTVEA